GAPCFTAGCSGTTWGLTYDYVIEGATTATGVQFDSGFFDVFYENGTDRIQVLRLNVTGSDLEAANLDIFGNITYDFNGDGTDDAAGNPFVQNFFVDFESGMTFYELWETGFAVGDLMSVRWILDTNINPPLPTANQLVEYDFDGGTSLIRQTTLDGSVAFQVPEPWTLGLFGAGLLALGFAARRRRDQA
ncbi:MAG: PEP-CTERM sorting domain-containing protein, partial [Thioalkalivibrio sp.]